MKIIVILTLFVIGIQALDISKLRRPPDVYPKYTATVWDEIKRNLARNKPGDKPQPATAGLKRDSRIIGGYLARQGQFPWQAFLNIDNAVVCGGSLISDQWILTAAHCTAEHQYFVITLGAQNIRDNSEPGRQVFRAIAKVVHDQFNINTLDNDISLLQLSSYAYFTDYVNTIRLPSFSEGSVDLTGYYVTISGWGKTSDATIRKEVCTHLHTSLAELPPCRGPHFLIKCLDTYFNLLKGYPRIKSWIPKYTSQHLIRKSKGVVSACTSWHGVNSPKQRSTDPGVTDQLMYVQMPVISNYECAKVFGSLITDSKLCTDTTGRHSTCNGDSGGPLIIQETDNAFTEVGIVSFGSTIGCELGYPAAFTRVTSFLNWIQYFTGIPIRP